MSKHWEFITTMIAIVGLGLTLANLNSKSIDALRSDMQAMRSDMQAMRADMQAMRAEARADREALGRLTGIVEEVRTARR